MVATSSKTRRPLGKPARSLPIRPRLLGFDGRRRDRHVQPQQIGRDGSGDVLETRDQTGRDAGEQNRVEVGPRSAGGDERRQVRERSRVQHVEQTGQLRVVDIGPELGVSDGALRVELVLLTERNDYLVHQRIAQPRNLHGGATVLRRQPSRIHPRRCSAGPSEDTDRRPGVGDDSRVKSARASGRSSALGSRSS